MIDYVPMTGGRASELLDLAIANLAAWPRWSMLRRQPFASSTVCVTEDGWFIDHSVDDGDASDGILVRGPSMWITGDAWKSLLFGSRMVLPVAVEESGHRWLRCDTRFGRAKIGDEADPVAVLREALAREPVSDLEVSAGLGGGYLLTGASSVLELVEHPGAGLVVGLLSEHGAELVAVELDGACSLPSPSPSDTLELDDVPGPRRHRVRSTRSVAIDLHHDLGIAAPDFAWVVSSHDIIEACGAETAYDVEELMTQQGESSGDIVFDSSGDQLIAFCRTREAGEGLVAALRALTS